MLPGVTRRGINAQYCSTSYGTGRVSERGGTEDFHILYIICDKKDGGSFQNIITEFHF